MRCRFDLREWTTITGLKRFTLAAWKALTGLKRFTLKAWCDYMESQQGGASYVGPLDLVPGAVAA